MHVLIVEEDGRRRAELEVAFLRAGFQVTATESQIIAESCIRGNIVDLLMIAERVDQRLTHALSLLAECRNPVVETILSSPRCDANIEELFLLLPSLHCIVGEEVAPSLITKIAVSALEGAENKHAPLVLTSSHRIRSTHNSLSPYFTARPKPPVLPALEDFAAAATIPQSSQANFAPISF